jgi:hypothetical protein
MQLAELRFEHAATPSDRAAIAEEISEIASTFDADLEVAAQRSLQADRG